MTPEPPPVGKAREAFAEGAALPGDAAAPGPEGVKGVPVAAEGVSPLALLLTGHLIPDGEVVILLLKPSLWFIPLSSLMTLGVAALIALAGLLFAGTPYWPTALGSPATAVNFAVLLAAARVMWATLIWMGRYYVLTDMRVMALSGVFSTQVFQCPLRRVARVRVLRNFRDRMLRVGHVEIIPQDELVEVGLWQSVPRPRQVRDRLAQAIARAKSGGRGN
jgi:hypothetical protein